MTLDDMKNYDVSIRDPINIDYRGYKLWSCGAPSSGSVALSTLKTIEGYEMHDPLMLNLSTHRLDEAIRYAYGAHAELGDPEFVQGLDAFEAAMLRPTTAAAIRANISDHHTKNVSAYDPKGYESRETHGTSHVVTADASGMSITLTTTINLLFGSQLMVPETGKCCKLFVSSFPMTNQGRCYNEQ
jgi:gamma-glutamyltranspeptidase/glutathione hydrolase